jgi:hypothetical protein
VARTKLYTDDVCELLQIRRKTWSGYVARGSAPKADGVDLPAPGRSTVRPWWWSTTIDRYRAGRRRGTKA